MSCRIERARVHQLSIPNAEVAKKGTLSQGGALDALPTKLVHENSAGFERQLQKMREASERVGRGYYGMQWLKSRVTVSLKSFAMARSGFPSLSRSPMETEKGALPVA